jgi:homoserine dehydrogenase
MRVGLLGFGVVGGGVGLILTQEKDKIKALLGEDVVIVKALVKDVKEHLGTPFEHFVTEQVEDVLEDPTIDVIFEALGGIDLPFEWISRAIKAKKHVITANKAVIAAYYPKLQSLANENGVTLSVEACVGGGIPIISTVEDHALFGHTVGVYGILNGTGNYILTKIERESWTFEDALKDAQRLGYAEAIPDDDVDGFDAARKILILTALIYGQHFVLEDVFIQSIRKVATLDFENLSKLGRTIRFVVSTEYNEDGLYLAARPLAVHKTSVLGQTNYVDNCLVIKHSHLNEISLKGPGAGRLPTANAMVADLVRLKGKQFSKKPVFQNGQLGIVPTKNYYVRAEGDILTNLKEQGYVMCLHEGFAEVNSDNPHVLVKLIESLTAHYFFAEMDT